MTQATTAFGVQFRVDSSKAPHARPYENGSLRNPGMVRHPVYGNREVWCETPIRPFFYNSVTDKADQVVDAIGDIVARVAEEHGF